MNDYSKCKLSGKYYTGAERKKGILIDDQPYIVKFAKNSSEGPTFGYISEYLGSHIFAEVGIHTQETLLGTYKGENVVLMKDFIGENETFVPFNDVGDSSLERDKELYRYTYEDIESMLLQNSKLTDTSETINHFWDMYIIDALIGNFDRHGANWGFLKKDNQYRLAPVYDNGSSLFPRLNTDEKLTRILNSEAEMKERVFQFPTSQILLNGKKSSYFDVINSLSYEHCNHALSRMYEQIDFKEIEKLVNTTENISEVRRDFYLRMLSMRFAELIEKPYKKLIKTTSKIE